MTNFWSLLLRFPNAKQRTWAWFELCFGWNKKKRMQVVDTCYVCGFQALTDVVYCRNDHKRKGQPYFSFLTTLNPAPGSQQISADGSVRLCNLCSSILFEQWKCFEKRNVPLAGRQFWLKNFCPNDRGSAISASPQLSMNSSDNCDSPSPTLSNNEPAKCSLCTKVINTDEKLHRIPAQLKPKSKQSNSNVETVLCNGCFSKDADLQKRLSDLAQSHVISSMAARTSSSGLDSTKQQLVSLYENLMMQFHLSGMVDQTILGQLQQLSAAEALASLQSSSRISVAEPNENHPSHQATSKALVKTEK